MKVLVIAEKPDVAKGVMKVLSPSAKYKNGYYESDEYIFSWAVGHLVTLKNPHEYDEKYKRWTLEDLPILPSPFENKVIANTKDQFKTVKNLIKRKDIDFIVNACDSDREGEYIYRLIYDEVGEQKEVKRAWFDSKTDAEITKAFNNLKPQSEYDGLYKSARARAITDWVIGMNFSRLHSIHYGDKLTAGRVQTPLLKAIIDRDKEINNFKPEDFYEIEGVFENISTRMIDEASKNVRRFSDIKTVDELVSVLKEKEVGVIKSIDTIIKTSNIPKLYDLTSLQREVSKKFKLSAKETLSIAQNLYEKHKLITYPRSDSNYLRESYRSEIDEVVMTLGNDGLEPTIISDIKSKKLPINDKIFNDKKITSHHAIIPTGESISGKGLSEKERKVYELIVKRLLLQFAGEFKYEETEVLIGIDEHSFLTKGKKIIEKGFTAYQSKDTKDVLIPFSWIVGNNIKLDEINRIDKQTSAPSPYKEDTLLGFMKKNKLGTTATRASIIEGLKKKEYVSVNKGILKSTLKGRIDVAVAPDEVKTPVMTAEMEDKLLEIEKNNDYGDYFESLFNFVKEQISSFKVNEKLKSQIIEAKSKSESSNSLGVCPICGTEVRENSKAFSCINRECKFVVWKNDKLLAKWGINEVKKSQVKSLLSKGYFNLKKKKVNTHKVTLEKQDNPKYPTRWNFTKIG